jgi:hypothetical protein
MAELPCHSAMISASFAASLRAKSISQLNTRTMNQAGRAE